MVQITIPEPKTSTLKSSNAKFNYDRCDRFKKKLPFELFWNRFEIVSNITTQIMSK